MRLIMLGNGPFAVPTLRALWASGHDVLHVVVRPTRTGQGRHRNPPPSPLHQAAIELNADVMAPRTVNDDVVRTQLAVVESDLCVVCDYGEILRQETIDLPRLGAINLHGSLLPKYRGAAPVAWAIYHGEIETGNTVFQLTAGVDAGPILGQRSTPIDRDETAGELEVRLAEQGASLVVDVVDQLASGTLEPVEQNRAAATRAPRLTKADGRIDWSRSTAQIQNQVRAMQPWPRAFTEWQQPGAEPLRLIVTRVAAVDSLAGKLETNVEGSGERTKGRFALEAPGTVLESGRRLVIASGDGAIEINELQPAGKRAMPTQQFLRGHTVRPGERLGLTLGVVATPTEDQYNE